MVAKLRILSFFSLLFILCNGFLSTLSHATPLRCEYLPQLFELYYKNHYSYHKMTEQIKLRTAERFIKETDPTKTLLLEKDLDVVRKGVVSLFSANQTGSCNSLEDISKVIIQRADEDKEFVKGFLNENYKLDETVLLTVNPDKRKFPRNIQERHALLIKMIHFQISNYLLAGIDLKEAKKNLIHRYELTLRRLNERKIGDWITAYTESFATALDPHSSYLSQDNLEDFQIQMRLSLEGIGASLASHDGFTEIEEIIAGGSTKGLNYSDRRTRLSQ